MNYWTLTWMCVLCQILASSAAAIGSNNSTTTSSASMPNTTASRCGAECVRCGVDGCVKCARVLVAETGECARICPPGAHEAWAVSERLLGRVCYPDNYYTEAFVGSVAGAVLCLAMALCGAVYARFRPTRPIPTSPPPHDPAQLRDFHKQLDCLRPHAYTLLSILNNTRSQVRELYQLGNNDAAMAYSCVLSDLAKILLLLNKKHVPVIPDEWPRLASWADRILKRYNRESTTSQQQSQQVNQLVHFLQTPPTAQAPQSTEPPKLTTFKPPIYDSKIEFTDELYEKETSLNCEWDDNIRPPSYSLIQRESIQMSDSWDNGEYVRRESIWLEDELFQLGLRPQDELTTEL